MCYKSCCRIPLIFSVIGYIADQKQTDMKKREGDNLFDDNQASAGDQYGGKRRDVELQHEQ